MSDLGGSGGGRGELLRHDSLARGAADWIAEHIISGEIKPGEKLTETGLAERMGISRSPVREALQALSREGLIILEPRRGAYVSELNARDVRDLYACRLLIEPSCAAQAAPCRSPSRYHSRPIQSAPSDLQNDGYVRASIMGSNHTK